MNVTPGRTYASLYFGFCAHQLIGVDSMHSTQILISGFSSQERTGQARPPVRSNAVPGTPAGTGYPRGYPVPAGVPGTALLRTGGRACPVRS